MDTPGDEIASKRLGMNPTVAAQIDRYRKLERKGGYTKSIDVVQLFTLVSRRSDSALTFNQAGRRAARRAVGILPLPIRALRKVGIGPLGSHMGFAAARGLVAKVFGLEMRDDDGSVVAHGCDLPSTEGTAGEGCEFYGVALAELMRRLTDFDGAMLHEACCSRGDQLCRWQLNLRGQR